MDDCNVISIERGDTPTITASIIGSDKNPVDITGVTEIVFLAKASIDDPDGSAAISLKFSLAEITKDDSASTVDLIFSLGKTDISPGNYLPFLKLFYGGDSKQFAATLMTPRRQDWEILKIEQPGITESL